MKKDFNKNEERRPMRAEDYPKDPFSRFFDEDFWLETFGPWRFPRVLNKMGGKWFPRVDITETETEVKVVAEVPGVDPDNLELDVHDNRLTIRGRVERESETEKSARPYRYERSYGEFRREVSLPSRVKEEDVRASCKDGVLTVILPKVEEEKRKKIRIEKQ